MRCHAIYVLNLVHELEEKGASLRVLEPAIDTGGAMGRMVLTVLGMVAEMELGFIRDRQRAGIGAAKVRGIPLRSTARASCHFARKGWAPLRSPRSSAASWKRVHNAQGRRVELGWPERLPQARMGGLAANVLSTAESNVSRQFSG